MLGFLFRRIARATSTLLGTTFILFALLRIVPADPAVSIAGPKADPETLAAIRKDLGLDDPLAVQFVRYVAGVAHGDLGRSYVTGRNVSDVILDRVPATALLGLTAIFFGFALGLVAGLVTASRHGTAVDVAVLVATLVGLALPAFWVGNMLIYFFGSRWKLVPLGGYGTWRHLLLPAATLALLHGLFYTRFVHENVRVTLAADYVRTARAKGASSRVVLVRHALRNALLPVVTLLGLDVAALMSGVVLTETVFNWPGLGRLAVQAVFSLDVPLLAGTVLFSAVLVLGSNLVVDALYGLIDPRVQHG